MDEFKTKYAITKKILNSITKESKTKTESNLKSKIFENWLFSNLLLQGDTLNHHLYSDVKLMEDSIDSKVFIDVSMILKEVESNLKNINVDYSSNLNKINSSTNINFQIIYLNNGISIDGDIFYIHQNRLKILQSLGTKDELIYMILKFAQFFNLFQYPKISLSKMKELSERYDVIEGFSTPFNSQNLMMGKEYFSIFDENLFLSRGNFFTSQPQDIQDLYFVIHPPYIEILLKKIAKRLIEIHNLIKGFIFLVPKKVGYDLLDFYRILSVQFNSRTLVSEELELELDNESKITSEDYIIFYHNMEW